MRYRTMPRNLRYRKYNNKKKYFHVPREKIIDVPILHMFENPIEVILHVAVRYFRANPSAFSTAYTSIYLFLYIMLLHRLKHLFTSNNVIAHDIASNKYYISKISRSLKAFSVYTRDTDAKIFIRYFAVDIIETLIYQSDTRNIKYILIRIC